MSDFYFWLGQSYFRKMVTNQGFISDLGILDNNLELAFVNFYASSVLGNRQAMTYVGIFLENGIFPKRDIVKSFINDNS